MSKEHDDFKISQAPCEKSPNKIHCYKCTDSTWDDETYTCKYCNHSYKIYEDEMK